jgi:methyltransferase (TIGR00027 family)
MPRGPSLTAEAVCFFRAIETARPEADRVLDDPYAERFLPKSWRPWVRSPVARMVQMGFSGRLALGPGALQGFVALRHRWMDDALVSFLAGGGEQVVVLGAGYDSRALRFAAALDGRPFYEVDFPATQRKKQALIAERVPEAKSAAIYLPIDFERESLAEGLAKAHTFEPGRKTFFVWEGVAMYLHKEAIAQTLDTVRTLGATGSEIVCDMWSAPPGASFEARLRRAGAALLGTIGEPLKFSLQPEGAPAFFASHGFETAEVLDSEGLAERYRLTRRKIFPDNCVVRAVV